MRCDYCYNSDIVFAKNGNYTVNDILRFLKTRVGLLDGVVLSGGEATNYDLVEFCKEIKELGFLIKLDTNGTNSHIINKLIDLNLLDYIALDYKAPKQKFVKITHSNSYDKFSDTLDILIKSKVEFEVRTTLHNDLLDVDDINLIIHDLKERGYTKKYYLQEFLDTQTNIANLQKPAKTFDKSKLSKELKIIWR
jgi:pyruvate formate lyase activating enzyme